MKEVSFLNEIKWNDRFNVGVENIDKAHRRLFSIVSKLISLNEDEAKQQHACWEGIKYFKNYALKHFAEEEAYMQSIGYSDYAIHKSLHDNMREKTIPALEKELETNNYSTESVQHFIGICVGWLNAHIMIEDHAITGRTANKWTHQASEAELASLEKAIIQALSELFRVNAQVVSEHYSGEDFASGRALCYRLMYTAVEKKPLEVYLIYEERMLLNMLSDMLDRQIKKVDKTVLDAFKLLSRRFMKCLSSHFILSDDHRLEKIDVMTFAQIQRVLSMDKEYPLYSLLFNTEKNNYFAFCLRKR